MTGVCVISVSYDLRPRERSVTMSKVLFARRTSKTDVLAQGSDSISCRVPAPALKCCECMPDTCEAVIMLRRWGGDMFSAVRYSTTTMLAQSHSIRQIVMLYKYEYSYIEDQNIATHLSWIFVVSHDDYHVSAHW